MGVFWRWARLGALVFWLLLLAACTPGAVREQAQRLMMRGPVVTSSAEPPANPSDRILIQGEDGNLYIAGAGGVAGVEALPTRRVLRWKAIKDGFAQVAVEHQNRISEIAVAGEIGCVDAFLRRGEARTVARCVQIRIDALDGLGARGGDDAEQAGDDHDAVHAVPPVRVEG